MDREIALRKRKTNNHVFLWFILFIALSELIILPILQKIIPNLDYMIAMPIVSLVCCLLLYICNYKRWPFELKNKAPKKKMSVFTFFVCICLICLAQIISSFAYAGLVGLGMKDINVSGAIIDNKSLTLVIQTVIVAPIVEELVYRGFMLSTLKSNNKIYAIIITAIFFGLAHGNVSQFIFASMMSLVLSYLTLEYSIVWAILLHVFNNGVMGMLVAYIIPSNETTQLIEFLCMVPLAIFGIVYLIVKKPIGKFLKDDDSEKGYTVSSMFKSVWFYIALVVLFMVCISVYMIQDPQTLQEVMQSY